MLLFQLSLFSFFLQLTAQVTTLDFHHAGKTASQPYCVGSINVKREIQGDGFHRELHDVFSSLKFPSEWTECSFWMLQFVSNTFYFDKYQLENLRRFGAPCMVHPEFEMDLEKPSNLARPTASFIEVKFSDDVTRFHFNTTIPFHLRYQPPSDTLQQPAEINNALPFLRCTGRGYDGWHKLCSDVDPVGVLIVDTPVGISAERRTVVRGTLSMTLVGALIVIVSMYLQ